MRPKGGVECPKRRWSHEFTYKGLGLSKIVLKQGQDFLRGGLSIVWQAVIVRQYLFAVERPKQSANQGGDPQLRVEGQVRFEQPFSVDSENNQRFTNAPTQDSRMIPYFSI